MEVLYTALALFCAAIASIYGWKIMNWVWFRPKAVEKNLRQQGFDGKPYRCLIGDLAELAKMTEEARSKPLNLGDDIVARVIPFIHESVKSYGKNVFLWFGSKPAVVIADPMMIKEVFLKHNVFQKITTPLDKLLARGLVAYEGEKWHKHRRLINPAFQMEKLKHMLPAFYSSCCDMLIKWNEIVPRESACELDVWPYLQALTSDALSRTAFGSSYEEGRKIFEVQREQAVLLTKETKLLQIPGWRFLPTRGNRKMKENMKRVESSILEIINKRIKTIEAGQSKSDDLLGILLESNFKEIQESGNGMSMKDVIEECKLFYIAGQETTSSLLVWTMILLGKHPDWQARAREEVIQTFGSSEPDFQELNHLKIITMIFHEVLRMYPPAVIFGRTVHKRTTLGNLTLPAGTYVLFSAILVQHDSTLWGNNAKEFDPERFSEGVLKATSGQFSYFPFGGGPRICIAQNFAMLEAKMAMAMILKNFSFEISPSYAHAPEAVVGLQPQHGAQLILRRL